VRDANGLEETAIKTVKLYLATDINKDGMVNILDIFAVAWDFGRTY
jgi:hypothetical protein